MAVQVNMRELLDAGVHYGHQARRWNPRMKSFIFGERNGVHIIDLQKTVRLFKKACDFVEKVTTGGGHVLFVGTKRQARELVAAEAARANMFYINHRWLGGTLTNYSTIRKSIHKLKRIEKMAADGTYDKLPKKEVIQLERLRFKLDRNLGGIKNMPAPPKALFIIDAKKETTAIKEAKRLGIPVVAIADTNADPSEIDYIIPGNDDSAKSLNIFVSTIAEACLQGRAKAQTRSGKDDEDDASQVKSGAFYDEQGHSVSVEKVKDLSEKN